MDPRVGVRKAFFGGSGYESVQALVVETCTSITAPEARTIGQSNPSFV